MRLSIAITLVLLSAACGERPPYRIEAADIYVQVKARHPFLRDHSRVCVVREYGHKMARFDLYSDSGGGAHSNLYRLADGNYVLIDLNGTWFTICGETGMLLKKEWNWEVKTPADYLGCFEYEGRGEEYSLIPAHKRPEPSIYDFKDPHD